MKGRPVTGARYASEMKGINDLKECLCGLATRRDKHGKIIGAVRVDACKSCESPCAYGLRYLDLTAAQNGSDKVRSKRRDTMLDGWLYTALHPTTDVRAPLIG